MIKVYSKSGLAKEFKDVKIIFNNNNSNINLYQVVKYNYHSNDLEVKEIYNDKENIKELLLLKDNRINIFIDNNLIADQKKLIRDFYKQYKIDIIGYNKYKLPIYNIYFYSYKIIN